MWHRAKWSKEHQDSNNDQNWVWNFVENSHISTLVHPTCPCFNPQNPYTRYPWRVFLSVDISYKSQASNHGYGRCICPDSATSLTKDTVERPPLWQDCSKCHIRIGSQAVWEKPIPKYRAFLHSATLRYPHRWHMWKMHRTDFCNSSRIVCIWILFLACHFLIALNGFGSAHNPIPCP